MYFAQTTEPKMYRFYDENFNIDYFYKNPSFFEFSSKFVISYQYNQSALPIYFEIFKDSL